MTPKEKAEQLLYHYFDRLEDYIHCDNRGDVSVICALIAVSEILSIGKQTYFIDYWTEVKEELERMK